MTCRLQDNTYYPPLLSESPASPVQVCAPLGSLHTIHLNYLTASAVTDNVVAAACRRSERGGGHGLRTLGISGSGVGVTSKSLMALQRHCSSSLRSLDISFVRGVCLPALCSLLTHTAHLTFLSVWGCTQLSPGRVTTQSSCPSLYDVIAGRQDLCIVGYMENVRGAL